MQRESQEAITRPAIASGQNSNHRALWLHIIAPITSGSCDDPRFTGCDPSSEIGLHNSTTIIISHREMKLCLLIRQVLIPKFEVSSQVGLRRENASQGSDMGLLHWVI
ncbi:hypothetical protein AVEN_119151-1 [Araneus ventricosus]|uniref:Uncharacterized protein n=1 Tax=Araneus ventricosus TaxID=182803 RepID=A0A4Y2BE59_ARAVE|nr:hypothetical protein AVEN_119151-1 [Araneus ventricosus]